MSATPNNGVEVRGLRVLRTTEHRGTAWGATLIGMVFGDQVEARHEWHVLTVTDAAGEVVATRRFEQRRPAERARTRFVERVEAWPSVPSGPDVQALLDDA